MGPILGSLLATGLYRLLKVLEYQTVNPGQDDAGDVPNDMERIAGKSSNRPQTGDSVPSSDLHKFGSTASGDKAGTSYARGPSVEAGH